MALILQSWNPPQKRSDMLPQVLMFTGRDPLKFIPTCVRLLDIGQVLRVDTELVVSTTYSVDARMGSTTISPLSVGVQITFAPETRLWVSRVLSVEPT